LSQRPSPQHLDGLQLRRPEAGDGHAVHELIGRCHPLDTNSLYCNLLQCTHFADSCVIALDEARPVGFLSAYFVPGQPDTLFVWQVAVAPEARNRGLGGRMLVHVLARPVCSGVRYIKTTITESNEPSWSLFEALARRLEAQLEHRLLFDRDRHFHGTASSEHLVTIGPIRDRA
jgi:L-2,4-diaminobutyric acid acetyltransferase